MLKKSIALLLVFVSIISLSFACTIIAVGKDAMADGSTIITHSCDSGSDNPLLWIIPEADWAEGSVREIYQNAHYFYFKGNKNGTPVYNKDGYLTVDETVAKKVGEIPQVSHTYRYFYCGYSFMNEKGVAIGESTFSQGNYATDTGKQIMKDLLEDTWGIIDCFAAQDIALERASTAREAVQIMGDLVNKYGWYGAGEIMDITDGNEVWVAEFYGRDLWAAVRVPDDSVFVGANVGILRDLDLTDTKNVMYSPNLVKFAVEKGWYTPKEGEKLFSPGPVYAPRTGMNVREWRATDLLAPSLKVEYNQTYYPLFVKPDKKLTVQDIFTIHGDVYEGTDLDLTKGIGAGPFGDPFASYRIGGRARPIGVPQSTYIHIGQVKGWLPDEIKGISWFGYGAGATTYLTPLWPIMEKLPDFYMVGSRYEPLRRDSAFWTNLYVQEVVRHRYMDAIKDLRAYRDPKMQSIYIQADNVQNQAAAFIRSGNREQGIKLVSDFAYDTAIAWQRNWLDLGDTIFAKYVMDRIYMKGPSYPKAWQTTITPVK